MPTLPLTTAIRRQLYSAGVPLLSGALAPMLFLAPTTTAHAQDSKGGEAALETIVVTGSRIRRVDLETSSPVLTIDKSTIEKSGKLTVGDLLQEMPAIAGAATNPRVNNGGGTGAATVSLRGLGSNRTLVLVNGRRFVTNGVASDVNSIPATLIERIEVLKDGASAVYGSDAIGGVVNFILRENYQGAEMTFDYGVSDRDDGARKGVSFTFGHSSDRGSLMAGINYNQFDPISSGDRDFSKLATYYSSGAVGQVAGSSRNPNGFISLPPNLAAQLGCGTATLKGPVNGKTQVSDYRCYTGADAFNYQAVNLILTPQERTNFFVVGNYKLADSVTAYMEAFHNKTVSNFALAALPFDARTDAVVISKDNYYNPFGADFGSDGTNTYRIFRTRFTNLGQRRGMFTTSTDQISTGFKGNFGDSSWTWDAGFNFGHFSQLTRVAGYVYYQGLRDALGPSFLDPTTGVVTCGTQANPIANCTPLNIFNLNDPQTISTLQQYAVTPYVNVSRLLRQTEVNASGELFELPAGAVSLAVGGAYRKEYQKVDVDYVTKANAAGNCFLSQEVCGSDLVGGFNVKEFYGELFVPILKDAPLAHSLNLTVGMRYSDYNTFGNTTNSKFAIEWRPIDDLLLRGTVSEVFRAPNISELYAGFGGNAPNFADPCIGYTNDPAHAAACGAPSGATQIPVGGIASSGLGQTTGVVSGSAAVGYDLKPETGKSFDYGIVYDPHWLDGLSVNMDYYRITLDNTIIGAAAQTIVDQCYKNNASPFCRFVHRFPDGQVQFIGQPTVNLGHLETSGVDVGFRYRLPEMEWGNFVVGLDATYISKYDNQATPDSAVTHVAGHFNRQFGNFARWRGLGSVSWNRGPFDATWRVSYIGGVSVGSEDPAQGDSADACYLVTDPTLCAQGDWTFNPTRLHYGAQTYHNVNFGYNIEPWNTRVEVGVDNLFDKQPPIFYQNNVINSNTDVNTYDTIGRFFFARVTVKF